MVAVLFAAGAGFVVARATAPGADRPLHPSRPRLLELSTDCREPARSPGLKRLELTVLWQSGWGADEFPAEALDLGFAWPTGSWTVPHLETQAGSFGSPYGTYSGGAADLWADSLERRGFQTWIALPRLGLRADEWAISMSGDGAPVTVALFDIDGSVVQETLDPTC